MWTQRRYNRDSLRARSTSGSRECMRSCSPGAAFGQHKLLPSSLYWPRVLAATPHAALSYTPCSGMGSAEPRALRMLRESPRVREHRVGLPQYGRGSRLVPSVPTTTTARGGISSDCLALDLQELVRDALLLRGRVRLAREVPAACPHMPSAALRPTGARDTHQLSPMNALLVVGHLELAHLRVRRVHLRGGGDTDGPSCHPNARSPRAHGTAPLVATSSPGTRGTRRRSGSTAPYSRTPSSQTPCAFNQKYASETVADRPICAGAAATPPADTAAPPRHNGRLPSGLERGAEWRVACVRMSA